MARIKIKDLPKDMSISDEEMKKIHGGEFIKRLDSSRYINTPWQSNRGLLQSRPGLPIKEKITIIPELIKDSTKS